MVAFAPVKLSSKISTTVLTTDAAVSVDRTFDPCGYTTPGVARYEDRSGGIPVGYPVLTLSVKRPNKASPMYKTSVKLVIPTLEVTSPSTSTGIQPAPTKAYDTTVLIDILSHQRSTLAERQLAESLAKSLLFVTINASDGSPTDATASPVVSAIENFDQPY